MWYEKLFLSPNYRVISVEKLSNSLRDQYDCLKSKGMYGLLYPNTEAGLLPKPVDASLAEFIRAKESGSYFGVSVSSYFVKAIRALVVDGALGIPNGKEFVTGISALEECGGLKEWQQDVHEDLYQHIHYARSLAAERTVEQLSKALYEKCYLKTLPDYSPDLMEMLQKYCNSLEAREIADGVGDAWKLVTTRNYHQSLDTAGHYKLYFCPDVADLESLLPHLVSLLHERPPVFFKWITSEEGLKRPEKCVAYFDNLQALSEFADALLSNTSDIKGHHLPFTCPLQSQGFLYWGVNPFHSCSLFYSLTPGSWRRFVCDRMATAFVLGHRDAMRAMDLDDYVIHYLYEVGINPLCWLPLEESEMGLATRGNIPSDRRRVARR